ncbi:hypothetical protein [Candidatus Mycoplasma haematominutum]|uniref:Uncharacterized protein n=1 Tax=Candidatus Mycoplasma haematominutum 'Birmingham 1' TaxID=1116213 RepID=G8C3E8_9MOLU|nr:hypothetical protein [Candidatus Mycoplasma haematominutum]CCE66846.1 hypothetical protein MHM_03280 [Candidatus Mycoplasma haematominutum 'Birmingham 1']
MHYSRVKLLGALSLLLGAPSGATLLSSNLGSLSLENLFTPSFGGGLYPRLDRNMDQPQELQLSWGEKIQSRSIDKNYSVGSTKLPLMSEERIVDMMQEPIAENSIASCTAKTIAQEAEHEQKILKFQEESQTPYSQVKQEASKYLTPYNSGKKKLEAFLGKIRGKNQNIRVDKLSKLERLAFLEMYRLFEKLESARELLIPSFQEIANVDAIYSISKDRPKIEKIQSQLREMSWTARDQIIYSDTTSKTRWPRRASPSKWDNWTSNPFNLFLSNKREYDDLVNKVKSAQQKLERQKQTDTFHRGRQMRVWLSPQALAIQAQVDEAKANLEMKVAASMLGWINQIDPTLL